MPALSSTMTSGKIVKWNKSIGDYVNLGDIIMTVESDKADMDVEAFDEGFLREKRVEDGLEAKVGDILGILTTEENESIDEENKNNNNIEDKEKEKDEEKDEDKDEESYKEQINTNLQEQEENNNNEVKIFIPFIMSKKNKARINKWLRRENDYIKKDEILFHVEDDKSTIEVDSPYSGIVKKILIKEGEFADLNKEVAIISLENEEDKKKGEKITSNQIKEREEINENNILTHYKNIVNNTNEGKLFLKNLNTQEEKMLEERLQLNFEKYNNTSGDLLRSSKSDNNSTLTKNETLSSKKIILPSAFELINQKKLNPNHITDTQIPNRITYEDVDNFLKKKNNVKVSSVENKNEKVEQKKKIIELTSIQKAIKNNMMQTLNIPVFRVTHLIKTNALLKLYERVKHKISMTVILSKCVSSVLVNHPLIYSTYIEEGNGKVLYHEHVNIGNALGLKDTLLTPVLKQVDKKDIYTLSHEWKDLVEKGKNGLLTAKDMTGSNFYISNLGMFNTYQFDAILPKDASCILSVGTNVGDNESSDSLKIHKGMMTLTCDHRHIYGAHAAAFMNDLSKFIENDLMDIFI